jgi:predicted enzyme related to lactoylglutathione lyase
VKLTKVYYMVWVADMDRACAFYESALGLGEAYRSPDWTELRFGDATIALHSGASRVAHQHTGLGFEVDDVGSACRAVTAAGGEVVAAPVDRPDEGIRLADCADTEGNRFSLAQPIS